MYFVWFGFLHTFIGLVSAHTCFYWEFYHIIKLSVPWQLLLPSQGIVPSIHHSVLHFNLELFLSCLLILHQSIFRFNLDLTIVWNCLSSKIFNSGIQTSYFIYNPAPTHIQTLKGLLVLLNHTWKFSFPKHHCHSSLPVSIFTHTHMNTHIHNHSFSHYEQNTFDFSTFDLEKEKQTGLFQLSWSCCLLLSSFQTYLVFYCKCNTHLLKEKIRKYKRKLNFSEVKHMPFSQELQSKWHLLSLIIFPEYLQSLLNFIFSLDILIFRAKTCPL